MIVQTKDGREVFLRMATTADIPALSAYLLGLSDATKQRFGPHAFGEPALYHFYNDPAHTGYTAHDMTTLQIVAYSVVKKGYLLHDADRLQSLGVVPHHTTDAAFAPSVADAWQNAGLGMHLLQFVIRCVQGQGIQRLILWGGVQCSNEKAVNFYKRAGFQILGQFEYNGSNYDMVLDLNRSGSTFSTLY